MIDGYACRGASPLQVLYPLLPVPTGDEIMHHQCQRLVYLAVYFCDCILEEIDLSLEDRSGEPGGLSETDVNYRYVSESFIDQQPLDESIETFAVGKRRKVNGVMQDQPGFVRNRNSELLLHYLGQRRQDKIMFGPVITRQDSGSSTTTEYTYPPSLRHP